MPIDITYYVNLVFSQIVTVFDFMRTRLVFRLGGVTFNMFTLMLGVFIFYRSMAAVFGEDEDKTEV